MLRLFDKLTLDDSMKKIYFALKDHKYHEVRSELYNLINASKVNECLGFVESCNLN